MASGEPRLLGTLVVIAVRAKNLPDKTLLGKQHPYCSFKYGGEIKRTKVIPKGGQHPEFDDEVRFFVYEDTEDILVRKASGSPVLNTSNPAPPPKDSLPTSVSSTSGTSSVLTSDGNIVPATPKKSSGKGKKAMTLQVYADDSKEPKIVGEVVVDLTDVLKKGEHDDWYTLMAKDRYAGEVSLEMTYFIHGAPPIKAKVLKPISRPDYAGPGTHIPSSSSSSLSSVSHRRPVSMSSMSSINSFRPSDSTSMNGGGGSAGGGYSPGPSLNGMHRQSLGSLSGPPPLEVVDEYGALRERRLSYNTQQAGYPQDQRYATPTPANFNNATPVPYVPQQLPPASHSLRSQPPAATPFDALTASISGMSLHGDPPPPSQPLPWNQPSQIGDYRQSYGPSGQQDGDFRQQYSSPPPQQQAHQYPPQPTQSAPPMMPGVPTSSFPQLGQQNGYEQQYDPNGPGNMSAPPPMTHSYSAPPPMQQPDPGYGYSYNAPPNPAPPVNYSAVPQPPPQTPMPSTGVAPYINNRPPLPAATPPPAPPPRPLSSGHYPVPTSSFHSSTPVPMDRPLPFPVAVAPAPPPGPGNYGTGSQPGSAHAYQYQQPAPDPAPTWNTGYPNDRGRNGDHGQNGYGPAPTLGGGYGGLPERGHTPQPPLPPPPSQQYQGDSGPSKRRSGGASYLSSLGVGQGSSGPSYNQQPQEQWQQPPQQDYSQQPPHQGYTPQPPIRVPSYPPPQPQYQSPPAPPALSPPPLPPPPNPQYSASPPSMLPVTSIPMFGGVRYEPPPSLPDSIRPPQGWVPTINYQNDQGPSGATYRV